MKCTQCDSTDIIKGLRVVDRGENNVKGDMKLEVQLNPKALLFDRSVSASVSAAVCGSCGNVMFSMDPGDVSDLRDVTEATKACGNMKNHPRFKAFTKEDSYIKQLNPKDQARHFAEWLRKNPAE